MERLTYIDSLKGIGIILVVAGHLFSPYTDYLDDPINQMIYSFHMPLFFFLSGFVYGHSQKKSFKNAIVKKFVSLLLPYLCFSALYCFFKNLSWISLLAEDETHNGYWFTLTLFFVFLIGNLSEKVLSNKNSNLEFLFQVLISIVLMAVAKFELVPNVVSTVFSFDKIAKFYLFYQIGKYVAQGMGWAKMFTNNFVFSLLLCIYIIVFFKYGFPLDSVNIYSFVLPICGVCVIFNIVQKHDKLISTRGILPFLGKKSLEIYLTHLLFLNILNVNLVRGFDVVYLQILVLLIVSILVICISLGVSFIFCNSELLSLLLYGKGMFAKGIIDYICKNDKNV